MCGRVIAAIGLCHSFVNDPVLLRATNQEALTSQDQIFSQDQHFYGVQDNEEESKEQPKGPNVIHSEHYNPLTNMKYKERDMKSESTLEGLAVPSFTKLPIEVEDHLSFAQNLHEILTDLTNRTEEKPKNFYFTLYLLRCFIENQKQEKSKNDPDRGKNLTKGSALYYDNE